MKSIAVLITCFNRKDKTLSCLKDIYGQVGIDEVSLDIYVVDGGSKDGTAEAVSIAYPQVNIAVCNGLYWAGGMRAAWKNARQHKEYDYYWLLNDDTHLYPVCLSELLKADVYSIKTYGKQGIYVGSTCDIKTKKLTYGGIGNGKWIVPDGKIYHECNLGNANIMMVSKQVYDTIGGFSSDYTHGIADYDYTLRACEAKMPVLLLPVYGGECENDHKTTWALPKSTLKQRIGYLYSPKGLAYKEYMIYIKRFFPQNVLKIKFKLWMKTLFPVIWEKFKKTDLE